MAIAAAIVGSAIIGGGAALVASGSQTRATNRAADLQQQSAQYQNQAAQQSIAEQRRQFNTAVQLTAPRRGAENAALAQLQAALGMGGTAPQFSGTPGYQFARNEALNAVERSAAARGGLASGNTLTALQDRAAGLANQNYLAGYLQPLQNLALGNTAADTAQQGVNLGVNIGNTLQAGATGRASALGGAANAYLQGGNAAASGIMGVNDAVQGGLSNYLLYRLLSSSGPGFAGVPGV